MVMDGLLLLSLLESLLALSPPFPLPSLPNFSYQFPSKNSRPFPPLLPSRRGRYACLCDERSFAADRSGGRGKLCARATHKIGARGGVSRTREYREGGPVASEEIDFDTLFGCVRRHRVGRKGLSSNDFFLLLQLINGDVRRRP